MSDESRGDETLASPPSGNRADPKLLELLACPVTKMPLEYDEENQELISRAAGLAFPIRDGIPLMTVDAARELGPHAGGGS